MTSPGVPDAGLNVSAVAQEALEDRLRVTDLRVWLAEVRKLPRTGTKHEGLMEIMDQVRDESGRAADKHVGDPDRPVAQLPMEVVQVQTLLAGAWGRRDQHSLPDALYVELAAQLNTVVVTTDRRLARATPLAVAPPED